MITMALCLDITEDHSCAVWKVTTQKNVGTFNFKIMSQASLRCWGQHAISTLQQWLGVSFLF